MEPHSEVQPQELYSGQAALERVVDEFAAAMKEKLARKAKSGFDGWNDPSAETFLRGSVLEHAERLARGDDRQAVDTANLALFLWYLAQTGQWGITTEQLWALSTDFPQGMDPTQGASFVTMGISGIRPFTYRVSGLATLRSGKLGRCVLAMGRLEHTHDLAAVMRTYGVMYAVARITPPLATALAMLAPECQVYRGMKAAEGAPPVEIHHAADGERWGSVRYDRDAALEVLANKLDTEHWPAGYVQDPTLRSHFTSARRAVTQAGPVWLLPEDADYFEAAACDRLALRVLTERVVQDLMDTDPQPSGETEVPHE